LAVILKKFIYGSLAIGHITMVNIYALPFLNRFAEWVSIVEMWDNITVIGLVLYTYYFQLLILGGFVLLLAMIASISLALMPPEYVTLQVKHQDKYIQLERKLNKAVSLSTWLKF
jgi:NADH:ubiquinone oxidoreductase subunit 6 (subunit J)